MSRAVTPRGHARTALGQGVLILTLVAGLPGLVLVLPLVAVFVEALRKGSAPALRRIAEPDAIAAIKLTLIAAGITVPFNVVFGVCARPGRSPSSTSAARAS